MKRKLPAGSFNLSLKLWIKCSRMEHLKVSLKEFSFCDITFSHAAFILWIQSGDRRENCLNVIDMQILKNTAFIGWYQLCDQSQSSWSSVQLMSWLWQCLRFGNVYGTFGIYNHTTIVQGLFDHDRDYDETPVELKTRFESSRIRLPLLQAKVTRGGGHTLDRFSQPP